MPNLIITDEVYYVDELKDGKMPHIRWFVKDYTEKDICHFEDGGFYRFEVRNRNTNELLRYAYACRDFIRYVVPESQHVLFVEEALDLFRFEFA
jgi:hypothetical protein